MLPFFFTFLLTVYQIRSILSMDSNRECD